jgi:hypothetical protein
MHVEDTDRRERGSDAQADRMEVTANGAEKEDRLSALALFGSLAVNVGVSGGHGCASRAMRFQDQGTKAEFSGANMTSCLRKTIGACDYQRGCEGRTRV